MLRVFIPGASEGEVVTVADGAALPAGAVWVDMLSPTPEEEATVERELGVLVPTRDEIVEIEPSSRLYREGKALYLTASLLTGPDAETPIIAPVSFVLTDTHLVTVRYEDPKVFSVFGAHAQRSPVLCADAPRALVNLLDAIVDRLADKLEGVAGELDQVSRRAFRRSPDNKQQRVTNVQLQALLTRIGRSQDVISKARHSAVSLERLLGFLSFALKTNGRDPREQLKTVSRDVAYLTGYAGYLGENVTFLLNAALGLISVEQNAIIKIFSVAAVIFLPPTLVASVYGMNFDYMPELKWLFGYPFALGVMILSAILPYLFFKRQGWL